MKKNYSGKNDIRIRITHSSSGIPRFQTIITHPMETGRRKHHKTGLLVPADYIETVSIHVDGELYTEFYLGENAAKNPYFSFEFREKLKNDQHMEVSWLDNNLNKTEYNFVLQFSEGNKFHFRKITTQPKAKVKSLTSKKGPVCKTRPAGSAQ